MEIKNRLFPYPVLCEDTDDYTKGSFTVETEIVSQDINSLVLKFDIHLDNNGIRALISQGKAEYIIHIECSSTAFRTVIHTFSEVETYRISSSKVNGEVSLLGMIVSKKDIRYYRNNALNPDYEDIDLSIPKAAIMAYYNMPKINILKNYEELAQEDSIFSVVRELRLDQNEEHPIHFSLDPDRIKIFVDDQIFKAYIQYQNNQSMKPLILSVLVMPALTYMIEELRNNYEEYEGCKWFVKFSKYYKQQGIEFIYDIIEGEKTIVEIVQELLQLPIGKTFLNMQEMLGE